MDFPNIFHYFPMSCPMIFMDIPSVSRTTPVAPWPRGASPRSKACCKIWRQFCCRRISWRFHALDLQTEMFNGNWFNQNMEKYMWKHPLQSTIYVFSTIYVLDKEMKNVDSGCFHMSHTHTHIYIYLFICHSISFQKPYQNHISCQISMNDEILKILSYHIISNHII